MGGVSGVACRVAPTISVTIMNVRRTFTAEARATMSRLTPAVARLAGDDAAGDARAGVPGRVRLLVIRIGVDHERGAAAPEQSMTVRGEGDARIHEARVRRAVRTDDQVREIPRVGPRGIVEPVVLTVRVEMPARACERRRLALAHLVEMDAVRTGSEAGDVHAEPHPGALRGDGGVAAGLTLGIHQLDRHVPGLRSPRAERCGQREHDSCGNAVKSLHRGPLLL